MRLKFASVLVFLLLACPAFLLPEQVLSENFSAQPERRITLLNHHDNSKKSSVSFRDNDYDSSIGPRHNPDLLYGALSFNGERDWFKVAFESRDQSRIRDLGAMDWSDDIPVQVLPIIPCPGNEPCGRIQIPPSSSGKKIHDEDVNPHIAKAIVGHMYLVHTHDKERDLYKPSDFDEIFDFYTLVRVEELKANQRCTITWKRVPSPRK